MFQIDEKSLADSRTLITIQKNKSLIDVKQKNGTINFTSDLGQLWLTTSKIRDAYIKKESNPLSKLDRILIASNGTDVNGEFSFDNQVDFKDNVNINKNLIVKGNLLVQGDTTTVDTPSLTIEDNIIELNKNETSAGITLGKAGLAINRGSSSYARALFNEQDKTFCFEVNQEIDGALSDNWILKAYSEANGSHLKGEVEIKSLLLSPSVKITDSLIASEATLDSLTVRNGSVLNGALVANSTAEFKGILTADNKVKLNNTLDVAGESTLKSATKINSTLTVEGATTLKGTTAINNTLTVTAGGTNITGNSVFNSGVTIKENAMLEKDLNIAAKTTTHNLTVTNKTITQELESSGRALLGSANVINQLTVGGNSIITGMFTARDRAYLEGSLDLRGDALLKGNVDIKGNISVQTNATVSGNLEVKGSINASGGIDVEGNQSITGSVTAKDFLGDNYKVNSVDGNGIEFWNSGDLFKISMSSTSNQTLGGKFSDAASSDYNMYFDMKQGTNRGFVFKNNGTPVFHVEGSGIVRAKGDMYANGSKVLRVADEGHNNGIDADTIDGKHHSDLQAEFVNVTGDTMTGKLTVTTNNNQLNLKRGNNILVASTSANDGEFLFGGRLESETADFITDYIRIGKNKLIYNTGSTAYNIFHEGHKPQWQEIESKPSVYPPAVHNHDDLYFTKNEITNKFNDVNEKIAIIEQKIGTTKTISINAGDWTKNNETQYYEKTVTHNMNININSLEVRFFDSTNTAVMAAYDFVNNNTIKVYNDEATILTVVVCGVTYLNKNINNTPEMKIEMLNKRVIELESIINKHFKLNS